MVAKCEFAILELIKCEILLYLDWKGGLHENFQRNLSERHGRQLSNIFTHILIDSLPPNIIIMIK